MRLKERRNKNMTTEKRRTKIRRLRRQFIKHVGKESEITVEVKAPIFGLIERTRWAISRWLINDEIAEKVRVGDQLEKWELRRQWLSLRVIGIKLMVKVKVESVKLMRRKWLEFLKENDV